MCEIVASWAPSFRPERLYAKLRFTLLRSIDTAFNYHEATDPSPCCHAGTVKAVMDLTAPAHIIQ